MHKRSKKKIIHHPKWHNIFVNHVPDEVCCPPTKPLLVQWGACGVPPSTGDKGASGPMAPMGWTWVTLSTSRSECWMVLSPGPFSSLPSKTGGFSSLQKHTESLGVFENQENILHFPEKYILLHLQTSEISDVLVNCVGEDTCCDSMLRSQCLVSLCFCTVNFTTIS